MTVEGGGPEDSARPAYVEGLIARVLLSGGLASIALVLIGLALYAAHGGFAGQTLDLHRPAGESRASHPPGVFVSFSEVARGITAHPIDARAVIALGLTLLLVTPLVGVATAIPGFIVAGDYRYASIAAFVLAMLLFSLLFAGGAG